MYLQYLDVSNEFPFREFQLLVKLAEKFLIIFAMVAAEVVLLNWVFRTKYEISSLLSGSEESE